MHCVIRFCTNMEDRSGASKKGCLLLPCHSRKRERVCCKSHHALACLPLTGKTLADLRCQDRLSGFATPQRFPAQLSTRNAGEPKLCLSCLSEAVRKGFSGDGKNP